MHQADRGNRAQFYQIRVHGILGEEWADWFDGFSISYEPGGTTVLSGMVADQSGLYGLLVKLGNLGLSLISVNPQD